MITQHSRQKITEIVELEIKKGGKIPLEVEMTDSRLEDFLYPDKKEEASRRYLMDFKYIHQELAKPNITLTLLHEEYVKEAQNARKIPYTYRTFAEHYPDYAMKYKVTMRIRRKLGEILEVDWDGKTLSVIDSVTGEKEQCTS